MKYQNGDYEAVHQLPIWRERANCVFAAHLGSNGGKNEWEQLWGEKTKESTLILCCIPFFVQDIALGDEVEVDNDYVLRKIVRRSGQITFRIWFLSHVPEQRSGLAEKLALMGILMEWSSESLLALSAGNEQQAQLLANILRTYETQGLIQYETGRSKNSGLR